MGTVQPPAPALLILAAFSRYPEALQWAKERAAESWGEVVLESPVFDFTETNYYEPTMGPGLKKQFFAFGDLIDPGRLPDIKLQTGGWEVEYAELGRHPEPRPLNLDPGYITLGKLVLASTKDFAHRIYLGRGIYAEVTLCYRHGAWEPFPWTFADYRRADYHRFFTQCREFLHRQRKESHRQ
jgi:hypothetical protein